MTGPAHMQYTLIILRDPLIRNNLRNIGKNRIPEKLTTVYRVAAQSNGQTSAERD